MIKTSVLYGIAAALIGGALIWTAGSGSDSGISGWETVNSEMEQMVGLAPADEGATDEAYTKKAANQGEVTGAAAGQKGGPAGAGTAGKDTAGGEVMAQGRQTGEAAGQAEAGVNGGGQAGAGAVAGQVSSNGGGQAGAGAVAGQVSSNGGGQAGAGAVAGQVSSNGGGPAGADVEAGQASTNGGGQAATGAAGGTADQAGKVNVNTAGTAELMDLPGIGEKKAAAIIEYRTSKGPFRSLSDLGKVKGIGTKMLEKLKAEVVF
ncbi:ComEA family DNA-binding protein [Paenibacillus donghaensis]|nr:helix-hairpin-helix domain-containing protein [Paenibacillus donghaensis]